MIPQITCRSFSVRGFFAPPFIFVAPSFQRPFAWEVETAERLLGDIQAAADAADSIYFLGAVLLVRRPISGEQPGKDLSTGVFTGPERVFEIIDGQQRIVTLALLLAVLRDLTGRSDAFQSHQLAQAIAASGQGVLRLQLRGQDHAILAHCVGDSGTSFVSPPDDLTSEAQQRLLDIRNFFLTQLQSLDDDGLRRLATFVLENCALVVVVTNTIDRAYQMFTVLNDSGVLLTRGDILKAELIGQIDESERTRATDVWDDIERRLGGSFEQLFGFLRAQDGRASAPIVDAVRAQVAANPGGAAAFVFDSLAPAGRIVDVILHASHTGTPQSPAINNLLRYLGWLPGQEWVAPLLAYWSEHGTDTQALLSFLTALDRFAYGARLQGLGADKRAQRMATVIASIEPGHQRMGPWPSLGFNRDEVRAIHFSLRDLHKRSPQICRLVLLRLDEHFGGTPMPESRPLTVEHILPLKVAPNSKWRAEFPDADARQQLATCLGNLTLVPGTLNERAANHDFAKKVGIYFSDATQPVSKLTAELRKIQTWTPKQIEARLERLTRALDELWQFG